MSFLSSSFRRSATTTLPSITRAAAFSTTRPSQLARLTLVGRLGSEPELLETRDGGHLVKYVVATQYGPKDNRKTSWFHVANFAAAGPARDYVMALQKGTLIYLEGDASMRAYEDANGKQQTSLNLVQTKLEVLKRPTPAAVEEGTST